MTRGIISAVCAISLLIIVACANESRGPAGGPTGGSKINVKDFPNVPHSIYGRWSADTADFGSNLVYLLTLYFNEDQIGVKRTCIGSHDEVSAATVLGAEISPSEI